MRHQYFGKALVKQRRLLSILSGSILVGLATLINTSQPAHAHHPFGGEVPDTFLVGFLSGMGHPVIGLDHLAFVIGVGAIAFGLFQVSSSTTDTTSARTVPSSPQNRWLVLSAFLAAAVLGTIIHLQEWNLPAAEWVIAASVFLFGILVILQRSFSSLWLAPVAALAGLFHGYAYGEAVVGAEGTPLVAYLIGFTLIQAAIAIGTGFLLRFLKQTFQSAETSPSSSPPIPVAVVLGGIISGVGFTFLMELVLG